MRAAFQGERTAASHDSSVMSVDMLTPPDDNGYMNKKKYSSATGSLNTSKMIAGSEVVAWMEFWDYVGGASFRAFIVDDGEDRALFAFFDDVVLDRELKQALMALIELADSTTECSSIVICLDRSIPCDEAKALMKSLQWVGFELTTLEKWVKSTDVTSQQWVFMGMEV